MDEQPSKRCTKCKESFPATREFFQADRSLKDGLRPECKPCLKARKALEPSASNRKRHIVPRSTCNVPVPPGTKLCPKCIRILPNGPEHWGGVKKQVYCKACQSLRAKEHREKNLEHYREMGRAKDRARRLDPEQRRAKSAIVQRWRRNNPERAKELDTQKRLANPVKYREYKQARRARVRGATGRYAPRDVTRQFAIQKGLCFWCKCRLTSYQVDHVIALNRGGSNFCGNIVLACQPCNGSKGDKLPVEWRRKPRENNL